MMMVGVRLGSSEVWVAEGALEVVVFDFVEAIHIELPHKTVHLVVSEVTRQHQLLEFINVPDHELLT